MKLNKYFPKFSAKDSERTIPYIQVVIFVAFMVLVGGMWRLFNSSAYSGHHAECSSFSVSSTSVPAGTKTIKATIKMTNDGSSTWSAQYAVYLGTIGSTNWNLSGNTINGTVPPGHSYTFNVTAQVPSTAGKYSFQPAMEIVYQPPIQNYCAAKTITVTAPSSPPTPSPPPSPTPSPSPGPSPSPSPSPSPGTSPSPRTGSGGSSTTRRSPAPSPSGSGTVADTTPPSAPDNFQAKIDDTNKSVVLSWSSATDNVAVTGYVLERSTDQQYWQQIGDTLTQTTYEDFTTAFGTTYYYRVKAVDAAGNMSGYVTAQISTTDFQANTSADKDTTISNDDQSISILIPAGALSQDAFCSVDTSSDVLAPNINNYVYISGPFDLNCRDSEGNVITTFNQPLVLTARVNVSQLKGIGQVAYFGQKDDGSWQSLKITKHDKKASTDTVSLGTYHIFSVMGKRKTTPFWIKLLEFIIILSIFLFGARFVVRVLLKRRAEADYDEYLRKSQGL